MRQKIWIFTQKFWLVKVSDSWALGCGSVGDVFLHHVQPWGPAALHTLAMMSMPVIPQKDPEVKVIISYPVSWSQSGLHETLPQKREKRCLVVQPLILFLIACVLYLNCFYKVVLMVILSNFYGYSDFSLYLMLQVIFICILYFSLMLMFAYVLNIKLHRTSPPGSR